jgi:hypothetical protein
MNIDFRDAYAAPLPDGPIDLDLTPAEREQAAMDQAQLRFDAVVRSLRERGK